MIYATKANLNVKNKMLGNVNLLDPVDEKSTDDHNYEELLGIFMVIHPAVLEPFHSNTLPTTS